MTLFHRQLALALLLLSAPFAASAGEGDAPAATVSWEVSAVSDYLFRGVSQTDEKPTLQGNLTWSAASGFYVGGDVSGVDYGPGDPWLELDYVVGYGRDFGQSMALDLSLNRYTYIGASELDYNELIATATLADAYSLTVGYTNNIWNTDTTGWYYAAGAEWALPADVTLSASAGRTRFGDNLAVEASDYTDWSVAVARSFGLAEVSLGYFGTDAKARASFGKLADNRLLLSVTFAR